MYPNEAFHHKYTIWCLTGFTAQSHYVPNEAFPRDYTMCPNEAFCLKIHYLTLKASAGDFLPNRQRIQCSATTQDPAFTHK